MKHLFFVLVCFVSCQNPDKVDVDKEFLDNLDNQLLDINKFEDSIRNARSERDFTLLTLDTVQGQNDMDSVQKN